MPGLTAWIGAIELGTPSPGDTVFISSAAGAVGQLAGFIIYDHVHKLPAYQARVAPWFRSGEMHFLEDIVQGLEQAQRAVWTDPDRVAVWLALFQR